MVLVDGFDSVLAAARDGADWAVAVIYGDLHPRLANYFRAQEPRVADDLESEVWLAFAQGIGRFEGDEDALRGWVFSIARRRLADYRRTAARRKTAPAPAEQLDRADAGGGPDDVVLADLAAQDAARFVVDNLPAEQAEIVLLRVLAGLSVEEVATMLGKKPGTIRVMQHRALRRLHAVLAKAAVTP
jgi:RNA polymerase sigma-70 factor (ECF subfamily)